MAAKQGFRTTFGNWSWGTPEVDAKDACRQGLEAAVELGCPVLLHEYDLPDADRAWSLYRHRLWWKRLPSHLQPNLGLSSGRQDPIGGSQPMAGEGSFRPRNTSPGR